MNAIRCASSNFTFFSPHTHKLHEIVFFQSGSGTVTISGTDHPYHAGSIALIPPATEHSSVSDGDVERIYLQGDFSSELPSALPAVFEGGDEAQALIELIYRNRFGNQNYLHALCHAYLLFIVGHLQQDDAVHRAVRQAAQTIADCYGDSQCDITAILAESGYAVDYIRARFKEFIGKTPHEYLTDLRIRHACFLLETYRGVLPLSQVAEQSGYTDYVHFSKTFKAIIGAAPREYLKSTI